MLRRVGVFVVLFVTAVTANAFFNDTQQAALTYDLAYIARNCSAIPTEHRATISEHILAADEFDGTLYIYEENLDLGRAFEAAFRGRISEYLCVPGAGCLLPPTLEPDCTR